MIDAITSSTQFKRTVACYKARTAGLFLPDGSQRRGSSLAVAFWAGFNGGVRPAFIEANNPIYRAGKHCRRLADKEATKALAN
jgi:hypothetical protein